VDIVKEELQEVFNLQSNFNKRVVDDWDNRFSWVKQKKEEWIKKYKIAFAIEFIEMYDSTSWKWWKTDKEDDLQNIHVEIVDKFHFLISCYLLFTDSAEYFLDALNINDIFNITEEDLEQYLNKYNLFSSSLYILSKSLEEDSIDHLISITKLFFILCKKYNMDWDMLYKKYLLKNKINHNRQNAGYCSATKDENDCKSI
jgi:dimeric dUTPase (all-alpha-NTP-PPase superfamily)